VESIKIRQRKRTVSQDGIPKIVPLGDAALLVQFGDEIDLAINQRVHALDAQLRKNAIGGVIEMVPAYASLAVHYDPLALTCAEAKIGRAHV
jgi:allophanate hydrolase subunit 1